MRDRLANIFAAQHRLQVRAGMDPLTMTDAERIEYIKEMTLACTDELHEALNEIGWKTWATSRHIDEEKAFGELRDAFQFLMNLMLAVYQGPPEKVADHLAHVFYDKLLINQKRIAELYTGTEKCPGCRRAMDELKIIQVVIHDALTRQLCGACGADLPSIVPVTV